MKANHHQWQQWRRWMQPGVRRDFCLKCGMVRFREVLYAQYGYRVAGNITKYARGDEKPKALRATPPCDGVWTPVKIDGLTINKEQPEQPGEIRIECSFEVPVPHDLP